MSPRLSVNISDKTAEELRALAEGRDTTVTEAIRRAVAVYAFVEQEVRSGKTLRVVEADGRTATEVVIL